MAAGRFADLTGQRRGMLVVIGRSPNKNAAGGVKWICRCDCGGSSEVSTSYLRPGWTETCGCTRNQRLREGSTTHGMSQTLEYRLLMGARARASERGEPCDLAIGDIIIPEFCPALGIKLAIGLKGGGATVRRENAPTLDRIDNAKGYVRGNVAVISWRANRIKCDAMAGELEAVAAWMRRVG